MTPPVPAPPLARVGPGAVSMHDARRREHRSVELAAFEIGVTPVTRGQWASIVGSSEPHPHSPVADVSFVDAVRWCNALSAHTGLELAYRTGAGDDAGSIEWIVTADGYRLPTEAEWEFACRAGTSGPHHGSLAEVAWTDADGLDAPSAVAGKAPNAFGLFDMLGNVWEWCWDLLDPARYGDYRVFRGGGFADAAWSVRASVRRGGAPGMHHDDLGFRIARGAMTDGDEVQGWSAVRDRARVAGMRRSALPSGWTPRR